MINRIFLWMDGSLFFRAVTGLLDFLHRVCTGSFAVGLISADYDESRLEDSFFIKFANRLLNLFPKVMQAPAHWPKRWADVLSGSFLLRTACDMMDTPIPPKADSQRYPFISVIQWAAASLPVWGLLLVTAGAAFLPTMVLAGMLVVIIFFTLFRYRFSVGLTAAVVLLYIMVTLFGGLASLAPSASIRIALLSSVLMFSFLLVTACLRKRPQIDFFFFTFLASAAGTGLVGAYQFVMKKMDMTWVDTELFADLGFRVYGSFDNPNVYGTYLLLAIPLCAAMFFYAEKWTYKLCALGVSGLLLVNLFLSYSRGCYLALAVAALIFVLLFEKRLVVFFSAGLVVLPFVLPASVINRLLSITNLTDSSTAYRISIWQASLRIIKDFWMTGVGQGSDAYNAVFPLYAFSKVTAQHAHNLFLQVFVETGLVGLGVFVALLACFYREQVNFLRRVTDRRARIIPIAMIAAVTGFLFQGMFDYVFYNYKVMLTFFLFMGLGCAFTRAATPAEQAAE